MDAALQTTALLVTAAAVVVFLLAYAVTRRIRTALPLLLEFLMAAGLIRLAGDPSWGSILLTVAIIVVRKMAAFGISETSAREQARL